MKLKDSWIKYLDWSMMKQTWTRAPREVKQVIWNEGYWSRGKGIFTDTYSNLTWTTKGRN
jgi:hypothetical protein